MFVTLVGPGSRKVSDNIDAGNVKASICVANAGKPMPTDMATHFTSRQVRRPELKNLCLTLVKLL